MWKPTASLLVWLGVGVVYTTTAEVVYVTDLTIFTQLVGLSSIPSYCCPPIRLNSKLPYPDGFTKQFGQYETTLFLCSSSGLPFHGDYGKVKVTDMGKAPCAASALSYNVMSMTYSACPEGVTELQSCLCSKNNNFASLRTQLSSSVSYSCGGTASADQASATLVYDAYCNQDSMATFDQPATPVSQYITDIGAWADLAPCARSALSYNVMSMTYDYCPEDASLLATCACNKNQNSLKVSQGINTSVRYSCSSHTADVSSAQAVFAAYCGLNNGTSSFPTTSDPPGDMTYYITALAEFSSLAPCAQSAVSYGVLSQSYDNCPNGPQALASCVCLKEPMPSVVSSAITSDVKDSCSSTASEDISSALSVWNYYCSAVKALVTPAGVTESVEQTSAIETARTGSGVGTSGPASTGGSRSGGSSGSGSGSGSSGSSVNGSKINIGAIVGGIVGAVVVLCLIAGLVLFFWRRSQPQEQGDKLGATQVSHPGNGKPELDSTGLAAMPPTGSPSPSTLKVSSSLRVDNVSPVSAHGNGNLPSHPELQGHYTYPPPAPNQLELQGQNTYPQQPQYHQRPEPVLEAYGSPIHEAPGQHGQELYEAQGQPVPTQNAGYNGMGWQSGPVNSYHEMDGGWHGHGHQPPRQ
ncbi:hypothetical protein SUNI508_10137 [Seiridium unicorne]|uniref:Uncharacterized protein n=1 Tax=Seiridium unicorne TaxID=138068 RepID=A0ABR2UMH1_9PEZI